MNTERRGRAVPAFRGSIDPVEGYSMAAGKRKAPTTSKSDLIKTTLSLDVELYTRLCAKAAKRRMGISALAVEFIRAGLRGLVVIDRVESSDAVEKSDRRTEGLSISSESSHDQDAA
jgi:hypothetical protein